MNKLRKKQFKISQNTGTNDIFAILDKKGSDKAEGLDIKTNDSVTVLIANEDIVTDSSSNEDETILTLNPYIHVVHLIQDKNEPGGERLIPWKRNHVCCLKQSYRQSNRYIRWCKSM